MKKSPFITVAIGLAAALWWGSAVADSMTGGSPPPDPLSHVWSGSHNAIPRCGGVTTGICDINGNLLPVGTVFTPPSSFGNWWISNNAAGQSIACPASIADGDTMNIHVQYATGAPFSPNLVFTPSCYGWVGGTAPTPTAVVNKVDHYFCMAMSPADVSGASEICAPQLDVRPPASWAIVNTAQCGAAINCATPSVDMTGADLIIGAISVYPAGTVNITTLTDSASNTYTQAVANNQTTGTILKCYYKQFSTPVSGSLSFSATLTGSSPSPGISVAGFKGSIASPLDLAPTPALSAGNVTSIQTPGGSTTVGNELLVACLGNTSGGTTSAYSINGGFNLVAVQPAVVGASNGSALGWLVQSAAGAITPPTFSWTTTAQAVAGIMSFK